MAPCTSLSACSGLLKWLDDGTDFEFNASFMDDIEVSDMSAGDHFILDTNTGTLQTTSEPQFTLCQAEAATCKEGMKQDNHDDLK